MHLLFYNLTFGNIGYSENCQQQNHLLTFSTSTLGNLVFLSGQLMTSPNFGSHILCIPCCLWGVGDVIFLPQRKTSAPWGPELRSWQVNEGGIAFRSKLICQAKGGRAIFSSVTEARLICHLRRIETINYRVVFLGENKDSFNISIFTLVTSIGHHSELSTPS